MNNIESLLDKAYSDNINVIEDYNFNNSKNIKGLYIDNTILLKNGLSNKEKNCILAEELGHHYTTNGDIIDTKQIVNQKAEQKARRWAYDDRIGLRGLIKAYENNCKTKFEIAELLDVTEEFLNDAIEAYSVIYGVSVQIDNYLINFIPNLNVIKILND